MTGARQDPEPSSILDKGRGKRGFRHWAVAAKQLVLLGSLLSVLLLIFTWFLPWQQRVRQVEREAIRSGQALLSQIQADRLAYLTQVNPQEAGELTVSDVHRLTPALPLPATFYTDIRDMVTFKPTSYQVRLVSPWPINTQNGSDDPFLKDGFRQLARDPNRIYSRREQLAGSTVIRLLAADKAVTDRCVSCHNTHPQTPRHDFQLNDIMGGVELILPLDASLQSAQWSQSVILAGGLGFGILVLTLFMAGTRHIVSRPLQHLIEHIQHTGRDPVSSSRFSSPPRWSELAIGEEVRNLWNQFSRLHHTVETQQQKRDLELQREADAHSALNRRLLDLHQKTRNIQQAISEEDVYRILTHTFQQTLPLKQILILRLNASEDRLEVVYSAPPREDLRPNSYPVWDRPSHCPVIRTGQQYTVQDVHRDLTCPSSLSNQEGAYWCLPLVMGGRTIGVIHLVSSDTFCWTEEAHQWIEALISVAAPMIGHLQHLERAKRRALMDELTGIYNRRFLEEFLTKTILQDERRKGQVVSLLMMDLDHFKSVNDNYGHQTGDLVLKTIASTLHRVLKENDVLARYGGEEFTVVLPHTDQEGAEAVAERLRNAVEELSFRRFSPSTPDRMTISVGVATYPDHARSVHELLKAADAALYQAKARGRNQVVSAPAYTETTSVIRSGVKGPV